MATVHARELYERIAAPTGFYELLASEALGRPITEPAAPAPLTEQEREAAARHPGLQRALAAIQLGLRSEGVREWHYTVALHTPGGKGERELLAAADLACRQQLWDRCINTSERTPQVQDHRQRFPTPYLVQVKQRAQDVGLDPAYVYGLIRQESRFVTEARSHVGASGLMQVMPATARWTARRIGLSNFRPEQINDRDTNIRIGTAYLGLALQDFEGSMPLAAAAYNAGPSRARSWREGPVLPAEVWIENIPFDETRDYVKRVLANTTHYAALLSGQPQSLLARLGTVGPRAHSAPPPDRDLP
jgi:soluble lytic murein transglycosylase